VDAESILPFWKIAKWQAPYTRISLLIKKQCHLKKKKKQKKKTPIKHTNPQPRKKTNQQTNKKTKNKKYKKKNKKKSNIKKKKRKKKKQLQMPDHNSKMFHSAPTPINPRFLSPPTKTNFMAQSVHESLCGNDSKCNNPRQL